MLHKTSIEIPGSYPEIAKFTVQWESEYQTPKILISDHMWYPNHSRFSDPHYSPVGIQNPYVFDFELSIVDQVPNGPVFESHSKTRRKNIRFLNG